MNSIKYVTIKHEVLGEARVVESAVEVWLERGWQVVDPPAQESSAPPPASSATRKNYTDAGESDVTASSDLNQNA